MQNSRQLIRVFECYLFNEHMKKDKILPNVFFFFKIWFWIRQYDPFHSIIDKSYFCFLRIFCLWILSQRIWMRFPKKEFTASITKTGEMTQRYPNSYFSVLFWGWKYANSIYMGLFFKSHFEHLILKVADWLRGIITSLP